MRVAHSAIDHGTVVFLAAGKSERSGVMKNKEIIKEPGNCQEQPAEERRMWWRGGGVSEGTMWIEMIVIMSRVMLSDEIRIKFSK